MSSALTPTLLIRFCALSHRPLLLHSISQIAKSYGAYVVSTTSPSSQSIVSTLGADELIDYHAVDLPAFLRDNYGKTEEKRFDIIFDTVGVEGVYQVAPKILKVSESTARSCDRSLILCLPFTL